MQQANKRPGALTQAQMEASFAFSPDYGASASTPAQVHADIVRHLWGGRLIPVMAHPEARGRFAGARLASPYTACTGVLEMPAAGRSLRYFNAQAVENILCLEGQLEIRYGEGQERAVVLERFDMVSVPAGLAHQLLNTGDASARAVIVLNAPADGGYGAQFALPEEGGHVDAEALAQLDVTLGEPASRASTSEDLAARVTRFKSLVPYKRALSSSSGIPAEATEMLSAGSVFPLIVPVGHVGRSNQAPMNGLPGLYLSIAKCESGDDGPPPHAHSDTQETFFVLDGEWEFSTGFAQETAIRAKAHDILAVPTRVMRTFRNLGEQPGHLFVIIQGPAGMNDTVSYSAELGELVRERFGPATIDAYARINMTFDAEARLVE